MTKKDAPSIDDLAFEIESAVEDLFSTYDQIEIDPETSEVKEASATVPEVDTSLDKTMEEEADIDLGEEEILQLEDDVLSQLNHSLHSLEWEVTPKNITNAKGKLENFLADFQFENPEEMQVLVGLMQSVLQAMEEVPQLTPTFAPKALKDAVTFFMAVKNDELGEDIPTLEMVKKDLQAAMPQEQPEPPSLEIEREVDESKEEAQEPRPESPDTVAEEKAPEPAEVQPKESKKIHTVKETAKVEIKETEKAKEPFSPATIPQELPEGFTKLLQAHISMLDQCVNRIHPLENLFARTPGYGKLHVINKKLREQLEIQKDSLVRALKGDYRHYPSYLGNQPIQSVKVNSTASTASCPWSTLAIAQWKEKIVAFVPDQIAYVGEIKGSEKLQSQKLFPLAKLKAWPWSKLQPLISGELAEKDERTLAGFQLPFLQHPWIFQAFTEPNAAEIVIILFHKENGAVTLLDTPVEEITVSSQWAWEPSDSSGTFLAGHLNVFGEYIPVVNLEEL